MRSYIRDTHHQHKALETSRGADGPTAQCLRRPNEARPPIGPGGGRASFQLPPATAGGAITIDQSAARGGDFGVRTLSRRAEAAFKAAFQLNRHQ